MSVPTIVLRQSAVLTRDVSLLGPDGEWWTLPAGGRVEVRSEAGYGAPAPGFVIEHGWSVAVVERAAVRPLSGPPRPAGDAVFARMVAEEQP